MDRKLRRVLCSWVIASAACTHETIVKQSAPTPAPSPPVDSEGEEPEPEAPPRDPLIVDLGEVQAGVDVPFEVPLGALGFNIVMEGSIADFDLEKPYGIERILDPSGRTVHANFMPVGGTKVTSTATFDTIASASVPQSEAAREHLPPGVWKVRFGVEHDPDAKPKVKAKVRIQSSGDGAFYGGKLDLHIHVPIGLKVGGVSVDASKAASSTNVKMRVDGFFALTRELLGIERGDVVFHKEDAKLAEVDEAEIIEGFSVSAGSPDGTQALHILFTNAISADGELVAAGISPGIPGAATVFGRGVSGIIVATFGKRDDDVLTMLHEAGHFFGLSHTSELDGKTLDPLGDTPACKDISEDDFDHCPDRKNVMFPAGAFEAPVTLSATQKRVYRGSPIYRAFLAGTTRPSAESPPPSAALDVSNLRRTFRAGGGALSPVERSLALGYCGLAPIDPARLVARHGEAAAIEQLRSAANDADLSPIIRGRARVSLRRLGLRP